MECIDLAERGLNLLPQLAEGVERAAMEISLSTLYGVATSNVAGITEQAKAALRRGYQLLEQAPLHPMRRRLIHGLGFVLSLRADYAEAIEVATGAEALAVKLNDPVLLIAACIVHGEVGQLQGRSQAARAWIERGLALLETLDAPPGEMFLADPKVTLLGLLALQLLPLGLIRQARCKLDQAQASAKRLGQPMTRLVAVWFDALFEVRLENPERVRALAGEMQALVDEFSLGQGRTACRWFDGWADARLGDPLNGYRRIRDAHDENARWGMLAGETETLGYAVEARAIAGDWKAAEAELHEAVALADARTERVYLPQLFLLQAGIARAQRRRGDSESAIRRSLDEARAQQSPWHELIAITELCEHMHATAEERRNLAALVEQMPEAAGTPALEKARVCLAGSKRT
jgi:hypothetical protein